MKKGRRPHGDTLPLFGQGGAAVDLRTRLSACGVSEASYLGGAFAEAMREDLVRRPASGNL